MSKKTINGVNPPRPWWSGDKRVEPFMIEFDDELCKAGLDRDTKVSLYNKAYEAVYHAILKYDKEGL